MDPFIPIRTTPQDAVPDICRALRNPTVDAAIATAAQLINEASGGGSTLTPALAEFLDRMLVSIRKNAKLQTGETLNDYMAFELNRRLEAGHLIMPVPKPQAAKKCSQDVYLKTLENFCFFQATYDLLSGKLHRLDPVIGDQGCQWRVPFVLDAQEALLAELLNSMKLDIVTLPDFVAGAVGQYDKVIDGLSHNPEFAPFLNFETFCTNYWDVVGGITADDAAQSDWSKAPRAARSTKPPARTSLYALKDNYFAIVNDSLLKLMVEIEKSADLFAVVHGYSSKLFDGWKKSEFTTSAKDYLTCCKLLTLRVQRRVDCFGLSSVPAPIRLPIDDKTVAKKYTSLATNSWYYMDHVARHICNFSGNDVTWDKRGDDWDYSYAGDTHNLSVSLHKCLQQGYSTIQAGATYDTHLFFGPLRLIFMYQHSKNQPIIVDHRRLKCTLLNQQTVFKDPDRKKPDEVFVDATYELLGSDILYYEPDSSGGFTYIPNPTLKQQNTVGMCIETFSVITANDATVYSDEDLWFKSEDVHEYFTALKKAPIVNLILMAAATHPELPGNCKINGKSTSDQTIALEEAKRVYKNCTEVLCTENPNNFLVSMMGTSVPLSGSNSTVKWDILTEKEAAVSLLNRRCTGGTEYRHVLPGRTTGRRIASSLPFGAIHIYGCTFAVKVHEMNAMLGDPIQIQRRKDGVGRLMTGDLDTNRPK